jgi:hypothetical protein
MMTMMMMTMMMIMTIVSVEQRPDRGELVATLYKSMQFLKYMWAFVCLIQLEQGQ